MREGKAIMGCVYSKKQGRDKDRVAHSRDRSICVTNNHMVALTSTTLGVLDQKQAGETKSDQGITNNGGLDVMVEVDKSVIEEQELEPVTINAWELMQGLDDDNIVEENKKELFQNKTCFDSAFRKENARAVVDGDALNLWKMNEVGSPLGEVNMNNCYSPVKAPLKVLRGSVPCKQVSRRLSDGCMTDLKVIPSRRLNSKIRLSIDLITEPESPLFSPHLVATLEKALEKLSEEEWNAITKSEGNYHPGEKKKKDKDEEPLQGFEENCPPGGDNAVVLYTTTLRGIRKTFEECNNVRDALESYGICISERDVSMHLEFRNELRKLMGKLVTVPRLFIKGRYIGGVHELLHIHEEGKLAHLLQGIPTHIAGKVCDGCGGVRFVPCLECSGSCKLVNEENRLVRCPHCNENGLIQCPICC